MSASSDRDRFKAAMDLVDRALDLPESAREALLLGHPDVKVRDEARRLLDADAKAGSFLSEPAAARALSALVEAVPVTHSPMYVDVHVGPFRLLSLLGKGGMGRVWLAERVGADFDQKIALKILPSGNRKADALARFRRERQILARLEHKYIARLLDGGMTPDGRPWIAMEYAPGLTLTEHCIAKRLTVEARLELFVKICEAVQYAHRNLVIHRDLKPRNIVVNASNEPKLLDFGIAKLFGDDSQDDELTRTDERPMTPDYAAPEQVRGDDVTTATDVWALGVISTSCSPACVPFGWGAADGARWSGRFSKPRHSRRARVCLRPKIRRISMRARAYRRMRFAIACAVISTPSCAKRCGAPRKIAIPRPKRWRRTCGGISKACR